MLKSNKINFDHGIVEKIVGEIIAKTPGVSKEHKFSIEINGSNTQIDVTFVPLDSLYNVYDISQKIQKSIYFHLVKMFDLFTFVVNVTATTLVK
jgi:uncharacterized alkaline shock family protein YloU